MINPRCRRTRRRLEERRPTLLRAEARAPQSASAATLATAQIQATPMCAKIATAMRAIAAKTRPAVPPAVSSLSARSRRWRSSSALPSARPRCARARLALAGLALVALALGAQLLLVRGLGRREPCRSASRSLSARRASPRRPRGWRAPRPPALAGLGALAQLLGLHDEGVLYLGLALGVVLAEAMSSTRPCRRGPRRRAWGWRPCRRRRGRRRHRRRGADAGASR